MVSDTGHADAGALREGAPYEVVRRTDGSLSIGIPVAANPWIVGLGFGIAVPWLLVAVVASVVVLLMAPEGLRQQAVLGVIFVNLLFFFGHVVAVIGVWFALYKVRGKEVVEIGPRYVVVRRTAAGVAIPMKVARTSHDHVSTIDQRFFPGKVPHPRLEVRAGRAALRFGAGLGEHDAEAVRAVMAAELVETGPGMTD